MRVFDPNTDTTLKDVVLYLKANEAKELLDSLSEMLETNDLNSHSHINDVSFEHEITVVLYEEQQIDKLNERSQKIIIEDI